MSNNSKMGTLGATCLVAGNIIGAGAYMLPAVLAPYGSLGLVGWLISGIGALALALIFAQLASWIPVAGGPYTYIKMIFGDFIGFQMAFGYWFLCSAGNALLVFTIIGYVSTFFPVLREDRFLSLMTSLVLIWGSTLINIFGLRFASAVQVFVTILKIVPLIVFALIGVFYFDPAVFSQQPLSVEFDSCNALSGAVSIALLSFLGLESATIPADEVNTPSKTIPRATILGVLLTLVIYVLGSVVIMSSVPQSELAQSTAPYVDSSRILFGSTVASVMAIVGSIGCIGTLNGWVLLQGQVPLTAAKEGLFPKVFMRVNKDGTPVFGLVIGSIMMTIVSFVYYSYSLIKQFEYIGLLNIFTAVVPYLYVCAAAAVIVFNMRNKITKIRMYTLMFLSAVGFLFSLWVIVGFSQETVYLGTIWLLLSVPIYWFVRKDDKLSG